MESKTNIPVINFKLNPYEKNIIKVSRTLIKDIFKDVGVTIVKQAEDNKRLAHVCGTCRSGNDPEKSVVDANCKSHDIDNLYISDASIFPTSGGTNPALTIAANALRISEKNIEMKKILIISNKYQLFGGTEQVVNNEIKLLKKQGYSVELLEFDNNEIKQYGLIEKILFLIKYL